MADAEGLQPREESWRPVAVGARRRHSRKPRTSPCGVPLIDATNRSPPRVRIDEHTHDGGDCVAMCHAPDADALCGAAEWPSAAFVAVLSSFGLADAPPAEQQVERGDARVSAQRRPHEAARVAQRAVRAWLRRRAVGRRWERARRGTRSRHVSLAPDGSAPQPRRAAKDSLASLRPVESSHGDGELADGATLLAGLSPLRPETVSETPTEPSVMPPVSSPMRSRSVEARCIHAARVSRTMST